MFTATVNALRDNERIDLKVPMEPDRAKDREMKQVIQRVMDSIAGGALAAAATDDESAIEFADRCGFRKFHYQYEEDGHQVIVDVMDPSRTDGTTA